MTFSHEFLEILRIFTKSGSHCWVASLRPVTLAYRGVGAAEQEDGSHGKRRECMHPFPRRFVKMDGRYYRPISQLTTGQICLGFDLEKNLSGVLKPCFSLQFGKPCLPHESLKRPKHDFGNPRRKYDLRTPKTRESRNTLSSDLDMAFGNCYNSKRQIPQLLPVLAM